MALFTACKSSEGKNGLGLLANFYSLKDRTETFIPSRQFSINLNPKTQTLSPKLEDCLVSCHEAQLMLELRDF